MASDIAFVLLVYCVGYALPLAFAALFSHLLTRPRQWRAIDWICALPPGLLWILLTGWGDDRGRSFSNVLELPLLALAVATIGALLTRMGSRWRPRVASLAFLALGLACTLAFYYFFPALPE